MPLTVQNAAQEMKAASKAGDPQADELVADLLENGEIDSVNALFRTIGTLKPHQDLSQLPPRLATFLKEAAAAPPDWSDADVKADESFFAHHHGEVLRVERVWNQERDKEWKKTDDGVFMTKQAVDFYKKFLPPGMHDAYIAMVRVALTDKYADMAGLPKNLLDEAGKPLAAGHKLASGFGGGLLGGGAKKTVGVNPYKEILGVASKAYNQVEKYALHPRPGRPAADAPGTRRQPLTAAAARQRAHDAVRSPLTWRRR